MRAVIQRVTRASVDVGEERVAEMGSGLVVLVGVGHRDTAKDAGVSKTSKATTICPGSYKCYPSQSFEIGEIGALKKLLEHACQDRFSFVLWISVLVCASNQNMPNCACILKIFL